MIDWNDITIHCPFEETLDAVNDPVWQSVRKSLKGQDLVFRHYVLTRYLKDSDKESYRKRSLQVSNYVNALRRGGLIPPQVRQ